MINEINAYLDDMKLAWSPTTLRSERYRLSAVAEALDGDPANLWGLIQKRAPYTRVTIWTRVCRYWDWLIEGGHVNGKNHYKIFRAKNSRLFRNAYHRNHIRLSFDEVRARTKQIRFCDSQKKAQWLLANGLRFSEFSSLKADMVVGKGGRRREIYVTDLPRPTKRVNYGTFHRHLREVGLKPHDLRKACLTHLVDNGANEFELCEIAGWKNLNTASSYIKANKTKLKQLMEKVNAK